MLDSIPGVDPARKKRIIEVLDINPEWRMHQVSDGQRRRVQLAYGLMTPYSVLLLDEITVDLDVLGRGRARVPACLNPLTPRGEAAAF